MSQSLQELKDCGFGGCGEVVSINVKKEDPYGCCPKDLPFHCFEQLNFESPRIFVQKILIGDIQNFG